MDTPSLTHSDVVEFKSNMSRASYSNIQILLFRYPIIATKTLPIPPGPPLKLITPNGIQIVPQLFPLGYVLGLVISEER